MFAPAPNANSTGPQLPAAVKAEGGGLGPVLSGGFMRVEPHEVSQPIGVIR